MNIREAIESNLSIDRIIEQMITIPKGMTVKLDGIPVTLQNDTVVQMNDGSKSFLQHSTKKRLGINRAIDKILK